MRAKLANWTKFFVILTVFCALFVVGMYTSGALWGEVPCIILFVYLQFTVLRVPCEVVS